LAGKQQERGYEDKSMIPTKAYVIVDMDNFSSFERKPDLVDRLDLAIRAIEHHRYWRIEAGRISMNGATSTLLHSMGLMLQLEMRCQQRNIVIKSFPNNRKEIADHDLLLDIGEIIGSKKFSNIAIITNDTDFIVAIERFPDTEFFVVISDNKTGDDAKARFMSYPNVEVFPLGIGGLNTILKHPPKLKRPKEDVLTEPRGPRNPPQASWPGGIPPLVQKFLSRLVTVCPVCGYRALWTPKEHYCAQCGGGYMVTHFRSRPVGRNPLHPHRFLSVHKPADGELAGLVILPSHLQWQERDRVSIGRADFHNSPDIVIDDWLFWLEDKTFLSREQVFIQFDSKPTEIDSHSIYTEKRNVLLQRNSHSVPLQPGVVTPLDLGDYIHIGGGSKTLCILQYLGLPRMRLGKVAATDEEKG
jgi:hypothetical protein